MHSSRVFAAAAVLITALLLAGCGYVVTYDDAFPPPPLDFPRWDPPDSIAFQAQVPPQVETVVYEKDWWELLHPPGEAEAMLKAAEEEERRQHAEARARHNMARTTAVVSEAVGDTVPGVADSLSAALAAADSAAADSAAQRFQVHPPEPIVVELTQRQIDILTRRTRVDIDHAKSNLQVLQNEVPAASSKQELIQAVRGFIRQAEKALETEDYQGAANLAIKARTLADSLVDGLPKR